MLAWNIGEGIDDALCLWHASLNWKLLTHYKRDKGHEDECSHCIHTIKILKFSTLSWKALPGSMAELGVILKWSANHGMSEYKHFSLERKRQKISVSHIQNVR